MAPVGSLSTTSTGALAAVAVAGVTTALLLGMKKRFLGGPNRNDDQKNQGKAGRKRDRQSGRDLRLADIEYSANVEQMQNAVKGAVDRRLLDLGETTYRLDSGPFSQVFRDRGLDQGRFTTIAAKKNVLIGTPESSGPSETQLTQTSSLRKDEGSGSFSDEDVFELRAVAEIPLIVSSPQFHRIWEYSLIFYRNGKGSGKAVLVAMSEDQPPNVYVEITLGFTFTAISSLLPAFQLENILKCAQSERKAILVMLNADNDFYSQSPSLKAQGKEVNVENLAALPRFNVCEKDEDNKIILAKTGLGSSAALITALTGALLSFFDVIEIPAHSTTDRTSEATNRDIFGAGVGSIGRPQAKKSMKLGQRSGSTSKKDSTKLSRTVLTETNVDGMDSGEEIHHESTDNSNNSSDEDVIHRGREEIETWEKVKSYKLEHEQSANPLAQSTYVNVQSMRLTKRNETESHTTPARGGNAFGATADKTQLQQQQVGLEEYSPAKAFAWPKSAEVVNNLAQLCHCAAQGKVGSGFDVSAAVFGSQSYARFSSSLIVPLLEQNEANTKQRQSNNAKKEQGEEEDKNKDHFGNIDKDEDTTIAEDKGSVALEQGDTGIRRRITGEKDGRVDTHTRSESDVAAESDGVSTDSAKRKNALQKIPSPTALRDFVEDREGKWDCQRFPFSLPPGICFMMGDVQGGSETPSMVRKVLAWRSHSLSTLSERERKALDMTAKKELYSHSADAIATSTLSSLFRTFTSVSKKAKPRTSSLNPRDLKDVELWTALSVSNRNVEYRFAALSSLADHRPVDYWKAVRALANLEARKWRSLSKTEVDREVVDAFLSLRLEFEEVRSLLRELGERCLVPIEPPIQSSLIDATTGLKGVLLAGVPGAGGVDAIFALLLTESPRNAVQNLWRDWEGCDEGGKRTTVCPLLVHTADEEGASSGIKLEQSMKIEF